MFQTFCQVALLTAAIWTFVGRLYTIEPLYDEDYQQTIPPNDVLAICADFVFYIVALYFAGALSFVDF